MMDDGRRSCCPLISGDDAGDMEHRRSRFLFFDRLMLNVYRSCTGDADDGMAQVLGELGRTVGSYRDATEEMWTICVIVEDDSARCEVLRQLTQDR